MNRNTAYRPDIDGLRAIAVLAVVLHHLSASLVPGGYIGVDVFFVISGYLITGIITREMKEGTFTFAHFYERRARRIFPALFAVLALTLVVGYFMLLPSDYAGTLRGALGTLFFASNVVFWRDMAGGYFAATDAGINPMLHTWSLAVEEQFYVFFPIFLLLCYRYLRRHIVLFIIACAVVSLTGAALLVQSKSVAVFFLLPFRAWELLAGALLAVNTVPAIQSRAVREVVACVGLLAIGAAYFLYDSMTTFPGLAAMAPVLGAAAIIHAGASGSNLVENLLRRRPLVYVGLISYSLYLWHWALIVMTRYATGMESITPHIPMLFVASVVLASLSYHFIEQPFRRGPRVPRKIVFSSSAIFVSVLAIWCILGLVRGGFEGRFSPAVLKLDQARVPPIPFVNCDEKPVEAACALGRTNGKATVLLWGDSHLLAWAPALDESLAAQSTRAVFAPMSRCPPLLEVDSAVKATCAVQNLAVRDYLLAHPEIETVVMSAYWSYYFREDGPLKGKAGNPSAKGIGAAKNALAATIQWLRKEDRHIVLIGPVPVYDKSVPLALALEEAYGLQLLHSSATEQRQRHASFFEAVDIAQSTAPGSLQFLDPIQWLCAEDCIVIKDGIPLYRDSHHLSVAGALVLEGALSAGLSSARR